jgi:hypothetical protein
LDLAQSARAALALLAPALDVESALHEAAVRRAEGLPADQQLYGVPAVPHQRGGA